MTTEREVSLPFVPATSAPERRPDHRVERSVLQLRAATLLERRADDIAARWEVQALAMQPDAAAVNAEDAPDSLRVVRTAQAAALVRVMARALADGGSADEEAASLGLEFGTSAFDTGATLPNLLRAIDALATMCLEDIAEGAASEEAPQAGAADGVRVCRDLQRIIVAITLAATRGHSRAVDDALRERFRRLRHDLRNPLGTIRSALELMADETVPEETRRGPRFRAMIERNTAALDQLIVARLSDAEAHAVPVPARGGEPVSAPPLVSESRDDLARPRQRDDRQAGSF